MCIWSDGVFAMSNTTSSPPTYSNTVTGSVEHINLSNPPTQLPNVPEEYINW